MQQKTYDSILTEGRWVTEATFSEIHGISRQTLANWRYRDRQAGRVGAASGYPVYKRFGRAVRYLLPAAHAL
jgi:hypothetical protein